MFEISTECTSYRRPGRLFRPLAALLAVLLGATLPSHAEFPWAAATGDDSDPYAYEKYMFIDPGQYPPSDIGSELWKYSSRNACELYGPDDDRCNEAIVNNPQELYGVTGASVDRAWETTTGRPDVIIAVTDSGIRWNDTGIMRDIRYKTWLNAGELPLPQDASGTTAATHDLNQDGVFNVADYEQDPRVNDLNANNLIDPEDLIFVFSDGIDQDGNGYTDDFCGWDSFENDNDPFDETQFNHGSKEARDSVGEANNGSDVGVAPNCMVMHMRVGDSFVTDINDFAEAVVYAADNGASVVQCALGTMNNSRFAQEAIDYAYRRGVTLIASAADESAGHHNLPAMLEHAVTVNSIGEPELPLAIPLQPSYLEFRGCTNFGAYITASVPSNSCSSEATARSAGMAGLVYAAARNAVARGHIEDYGVLDGSGGVPLGWGVSAEEVDQIVATTADDINFLTPVPYTARPFPETERYPATEGWDPFFGYGRVNAARMVQAVAENRIPPEADITSPRWFTILSPNDGPIVVEGSVAARRSARYEYNVRWALWSWRDNNVAPTYTSDGVTLTQTGDQTDPYAGVLATIDPSVVASAMALTNGPIGAVDGPAVDPLTGRGDHENRQLPDKFSVILLLTVTAKDDAGQTLLNIDGGPLQGVGRKNIHLHDDPALFPGFPRDMNGGMATSPRFADLDNDGVDELIVATSNGQVHAFESDGGEVPGWPVNTTISQMNYGSAGFLSGEIASPVYAAVLNSPAVGDIDRDGSLEVVVGDFEGRISVFDRHGNLWPGFPVRSNVAYSQPQPEDRLNGYYASNPQFVPGDYPGSGSLPNDPDLVPDLVNRKDRMNTTIWSFLPSPTLGNIDPADDDLEILAAAMDRHLYAFKSDGSPVPGWPIILRDPATVGSVDPLTHAVKNAPGIRDRRGAAMMVSPAVGDLDGDGVVEVVATVSEQYDEVINSDDTVLPDVLGVLGESGGNNRVYALHADGALHGGGPGAAPNGHPNANAYLPGWPVKVGTLLVELLPVVGEGPNGAPVLADVDGNGDLEVGIYGTIGPAYIFDHTGVSHFGRDSEGRDRTLLMEPFNAGSNSPDTPTIPTFGGGIFSRFLPDGGFSYATSAVGLGKLVDAVFPDDQIVSDNHVSVWDLGGSRVVIPNFPREVNDLHILSTPASADIDGDGLEEILDASAYYDLHAFNALGEEPELRTLSATGWPKFTAGWVLSSPSVGDFNGDGYRDVALATREAWLFVWHGNGATDCDPASWPEWGHDGWNTNNAHADTGRPDRIGDLSASTTGAGLNRVTARASGGGTIAIDSDKGNFGFNVKAKDGVLTGNLLFDDKNLLGPHVKSEAILTFEGQPESTLRWTAPGDDGCGGALARYEIRYATTPITESTWKQATSLDNSIVPGPKGSSESLVLPTLPSGSYYVTVQGVDAAGNIGPLSENVVVQSSGTTSAMATLTGLARVDGISGHGFTVSVFDGGDPGSGNDWFEIELDTGYYAGGYLMGGNLNVDYDEATVDQEPGAETQSQWELLFGLEGLTFLLGIL